LEKLSAALRRYGDSGLPDGADDEAALELRAYQELVENANDIIFTHDLDGNITSLNRAGEQITGYTREEASNMNVLQVVAPAYRKTLAELIKRRFADEVKGAFEIEILAKDGRKVVLEVSTRLITKNGEAMRVQGIARDVTHRKHLEEQLMQAQKMEAIGHLAGGVAHDFNNLLTAVTGYSDLVLRRLGSDSPVRQEVEQIKRAGQRATTLTCSI
jgi:PAS domain S-box-containing protein